MRKPSYVTLTLTIAAVCALGACRNGSNNAADTSGMNAAAGQVPPPAAAPTTADTGAVAVPPGTPGAPTSIDTTGAAGATMGTAPDTTTAPTKSHKKAKKGY